MRQQRRVRNWKQTTGGIFLTIKLTYMCPRAVILLRCFKGSSDVSAMLPCYESSNAMYEAKLSFRIVSRDAVFGQ